MRGRSASPKREANHQGAHPPRLLLSRLAGTALLAVAALALMAPGAGAASIQSHTLANAADYVIVGNGGDQMPTALAAGYWDRDNRSDVLVCSSTNRTCWLFLGREPSPSSGVLRAPNVTFVGLGTDWGASAAFVGDLNGDGFEDIAVGAPNSTGVGGVLQGGSAWIFFSRGNNFRGSIGYYDANVTIFGVEAYDRLGSSFAPAGDADRDGFDDFWASAPGVHLGSESVGAVYLFRGGASMTNVVDSSSAALRLTGITRGVNATMPQPLALNFGQVLAGDVDLNGDGREDLLVASTTYQDASWEMVGAAFAFLGPFPLDGRTLNASRADVTFWGNAMVPSLGASLAAAENFMAEGGRVIFIGATSYVNGTRAGGAVYLFRVTDWTCCRNLNTWDAAGMIFTSEPRDSAGAALAGGSDINNDGYPDLVVGAPGADIPGSSDAGRVSIVYGKDVSRQPFSLNATNSSVEGIRSRAQLGTLVILCDFNGDGWADLFAASPGDVSGGNGSGAVYGFVGRPRNREPTLRIGVEGPLVEGLRVSYTAILFDMDNDTLWSGWDFNGYATFVAQPNNWHVTQIYPDEGTYVVGLRVTDGEFSAIAWQTVTIANAPPNCTLISFGAFVEGTTGHIQLAVSDLGPYDKWTAEWFGPANFSPSLSSAAYKPPRGLPFNVTVKVADNDGGVGTCWREFPVSNVAPVVTLSGPTSLQEGDTATYAASVADPGTGDSFSFWWFGVPSNASSGPFLIWTALGPGEYFVRVHVEDLDGGFAEDSLAVKVVNVPPSVWLDVPRNAVEGEPVDIAVRVYSGEAYDTLGVVWDFCGGGTSQTLVLHIVRAVPGEWCVTATVVDDDDSITVLRDTLVVANRAPLTAIRTTPSAPFLEGQRITLDPVVAPWETTGLSQIRYTWFLDGENVSTAPRLYLTAEFGRYRVSLLAFDRDGASSRINLTLDVENVAPLVRILGNSSIHVGETGTWAAIATDASGFPVKLTWDLDGQSVAGGANLTWTARGAGPHVFRVTADDGNGAITVAALVVTVVAPGPINTEVDTRYIGIVIGGAAAFAAGIVLGAFVVAWIKQRRLRE